MKYYKLNKEEKEIERAFEKDEFKRVANTTEKIKLYRSYAGASLSKGKNINIRLSVRDLHKLKAKAVEKGIPYQTLVASVLHQYTDR